MSGMYVNFETFHGLNSGTVVEAFEDGGFAVEIWDNHDPRFPLHNTEYVVFAKEVSP